MVYSNDYSALLRMLLVRLYLQTTPKVAEVLTSFNTNWRVT